MYGPEHVNTKTELIFFAQTIHALPMYNCSIIQSLVNYAANHANTLPGDHEGQYLGNDWLINVYTDTHLPFHIFPLAIYTYHHVPRGKLRESDYATAYWLIISSGHLMTSLHLGESSLSTSAATLTPQPLTNHVLASALIMMQQ